MTVVGHHSCAVAKVRPALSLGEECGCPPFPLYAENALTSWGHSPNGPGSPVCARRSARLWAACGDSHVALVLLEPQSVRGLGADHVEVLMDL